MKHDLIVDLSALLSYNVIGDIQYRNRYNGFIGELDFEHYMSTRPGNVLLDGGIFIPTKEGASSVENPVYFQQAADQKNREFLNWRSINMIDFTRNIWNEVIEGGTGMRSTRSSNPTRICPERFFGTL